MKKILGWSFVTLLFVGALLSWSYFRGQTYSMTKYVKTLRLSTGDKLDSLNGVYVYYNGSMNNVSGRNLAPDGYNIGLKYQCVEFVKRYYYEHLNHKMPDSYGHAKDFYEPHLKDGAKSTRRNLNQYSNPSKSKPKVNDLVVYGPMVGNKFGHVSIVSKVWDHKMEVVQQNVGEKSRETFNLIKKDGQWQIQNDKILGWLRKE